ncbi:MAG: cupredoxin domain-containing protein [Casimicrobiaceae bacterium]
MAVCTPPRRQAVRIICPMLFAALTLFAPHTPAEELPIHRLVARDGGFEPKTVEVAAGKRFKLEISNESKGPIEFESRELKQEKVLAAGAKSYIVINGLKPGTYAFFDDFRPDVAKGRIVAK